MNGIIIVDKPKGFTSFDVVAKMRGICATRKIGHAGTLDPMATGVLPVFVGVSAKAVDMQAKQDKVYEAVFLFGKSTDTGDVTGTVLEEQKCDIKIDQIEHMLLKFEGVQQQMPPMYSAVKVKGKPLYKYARSGIEVERKSREITIHSAKLLKQVDENQFLVRVHCSKGTYIRTLVEDVGKALGVPAVLAKLRRTGAGMFDEKSLHTLEEIQEAKSAGTLEELFLPVQTVFEGIPKLELGAEDLKRLLNGAAVRQRTEQGRYCAWHNKEFVGIVNVSEAGEVLGEKLFYERISAGK